MNFFFFLSEEGGEVKDSPTQSHSRDSFSFVTIHVLVVVDDQVLATGETMQPLT